MKEITIQVPDGKRAEWVGGVLTLVDESKVDNSPVTERIKTFEDACNALGDEHPLVTQHNLTAAAYKGDPMTEDLIAYLKLRVIVAALNEGWLPSFSKDKLCYYPWFHTYTKDKYEQLDEDEKKSCCFIGMSGGGIYANYASSYSSMVDWSRLAFKTYELAEYCGKQFIDICVKFLFA